MPASGDTYLITCKLVWFSIMRQWIQQFKIGISVKIYQQAGIPFLLTALALLH